MEDICIVLSGLEKAWISQKAYKQNYWHPFLLHTGDVTMLVPCTQVQIYVD